MAIKIIIPGGSGLLGTSLAEYFAGERNEVVILTRSPHNEAGRGNVREVFWDGESLGEWARELDGADALINLAGRSVDCRYHARNRRIIMDSRVLSTRIVGKAIAQCKLPPKVWLNSSTATIYRHNFGPAWEETGETGAAPEAKDAFSIEVALAWEREFFAAETSRTRKVALRSAMVLATGHNSVFPVLRRLVRYGLGGRMGSGRQYVSWIHHVDFCRAVEWLIQHEEMSGIVNVAAPNPLPNADMMRLLRSICGAPLGLGLPATPWMLEMGAFVLRTETELIIKSRRVTAGRLLKGGFQFKFPHIKDACVDLEQRMRR